MQDEGSCSALSLQVGEPLAGTAVGETDLWIALEHLDAWGVKGFEDSGLPAAVVARLSAFVAQHPRARVQLLRQPRRDVSDAEQRDRAPRRLFLARAGEGAASLQRLVLERVEQLEQLDLEAWARGAALPGAAALDEPIYLVCVHGRRDRCCARLGMPVYTALAELAGDRVWQTTHLGGHRFAATLLVLPAGVCYGRVEAEQASALLAAHARGELYALDKLRGRCAYPGAAQAAECALREQLGELGLDTLQLLAVEAHAAGTRVRFRHLPGGREHELEVERAPLPPAPASCGATPKPGERLVGLG
jgi:hypothetical protein